MGIRDMIPRLRERLATTGRTRAVAPGARERGITNPATGLGRVGVDKSAGAYFTNSGFGQGQQLATAGYVRGASYQFLDTIYRESWAARKAINLPVEDSLSSWRTWVGDERETELMAEAEKRHDVTARLMRAMEMGRLYGGALLVMMSTESVSEEPLMPERIRPGDLTNLIALDRGEIGIARRVTDPYDPEYDMPEMYRIVPRLGGAPLDVHASRVLRFCERPYWRRSYMSDWGDSILRDASNQIVQEAQSYAGAAHLTQEASILAVFMQNHADTLAGAPLPDEKTAEQMGAEFNEQKSLYHTLFFGPGDKAERLDVTWAGLALVLDRFDRILAASQDIPLTRWLGTSAVGLNATGDGDWKNWADRIDAYQRMHIQPQLRKLDMVLARDAGLSEPPEYEWNSLLDMGEEAMATISKTYVEAARDMLREGMSDEQEMRDWLSGKAALPDFGPWTPPPPEPEPDMPQGPQNMPMPGAQQ